MKVSVRKARESDIPELLKVEFDRYSQLYKEHPEKKDQVEWVFRERCRIANKWMWVVLIDGVVRGFISAQPTNKRPENFVSWEKSTNNGTLKGTYVENGKNLYVVNLDVQRKATKVEGQYMLMATLGAQLVSTKKELVMFESRMPGFRGWVRDSFEGGLEAWMELTDKKKLASAVRYSKLKKEVDGKLVRQDKLLRFYAESGFNFVKVVPEAFQDGESLNFGVLCTASNPIPGRLRIWPVNQLVAITLRSFGKNPKLLAKFVR